MTNEDPRELGYKVVFDTGSNLISTYSRKEVIYKLNEWSHRPVNCGPLCVYLRSWDAIYHRNDSLRFRIYRCFYIPSDSKEVYHDEDDYFWSLSELSVGTVLADSVMLLDYEVE